MYKPKEIIVAKDVKNHPVTCSILDKCPGVPVRIADSNQPNVIGKALDLLAAINAEPDVTPSQVRVELATDRTSIDTKWSLKRAVQTLLAKMR